MCHPIWRKTTGLYTFLLPHFCLSDFVHLLIGCRSSVQEIPRPPCQYHGRNQFNIKTTWPTTKTVNRKPIFIKWSQTLRGFVVVVLPVSNAPSLEILRAYALVKCSWGRGVYSQSQPLSRFLPLSKLLQDWSVSSVDEQSQAVQRGNKVVEGLSEAWLISQPAIYFEMNLM